MKPNTRTDLETDRRWHCAMQKETSGVITVHWGRWERLGVTTGCCGDTISRRPSNQSTSLLSPHPCRERNGERELLILWIRDTGHPAVCEGGGVRSRGGISSAPSVLSTPLELTSLWSLESQGAAIFHIVLTRAMELKNGVLNLDRKAEHGGRGSMGWERCFKELTCRKHSHSSWLYWSTMYRKMHAFCEFVCWF